MISVFTFHVGSPSHEEAVRQLSYLAERDESVLVLTDTANNHGCSVLATRFEQAGYHVVFPPPPRGERGVMIVSALALTPAPSPLGFLPHRVVRVTVETGAAPLEVIGLNVPSRDETESRTTRKERFLEACRTELPQGHSGSRLVTGNYNVVEPSHRPMYTTTFRPFEYQFYDWLTEQAGYTDAFRAVHPKAREHSCVTAAGSGCRFDHAHMSTDLRPVLRDCVYVHGPRTAPAPLSARSALSVTLDLDPAKALRVSNPARPASSPSWS